MGGIYVELYSDAATGIGELTREDVERMLRTGEIDPNIESPDGVGLMYLAFVDWERMDLVDLLIRYGVDIHKVLINGYTPLHMAIYRSDKRIFDELVRRGADIHITKAESNTGVLHMAAEKGCEDIMEVLLADETLDVNMRMNDGATPLYLAAQFGHSRIISMLIARGADPSLVLNEYTRALPIHAAVITGQLESLIELLKYKDKFNINAKIDENSRQYKGMSALDIAVEKACDGSLRRDERDKYKEMVRILLAAGADRTAARKIARADILTLVSQSSPEEIAAREAEGKRINELKREFKFILRQLRSRFKIEFERAVVPDTYTLGEWENLLVEARAELSRAEGKDQAEVENVEAVRKKSRKRDKKKKTTQNFGGKLEKSDIDLLRTVFPSKRFEELRTVTYDEGNLAILVELIAAIKYLKGIDRQVDTEKMKIIQEKLDLIRRSFDRITSETLLC